MKEIITEPAANSFGDLDKPPHVLSPFIKMLIGQEPLDPAQQEQRWRHLAECAHCQLFLIIYLNEYEKAEGRFEGPVQEPLTKLTHLLHRTIRKDMRAYVAILEEQGEEQANSCFPLFSEHAQTCTDCQSALRDQQVQSSLLRKANSSADRT